MSDNFEQTTWFISAVFFLFVGLTGCGGMNFTNYEGDGDLKVQRTGMFERGIQLTLSDFDARDTYQNHRQIVKMPKINGPHYFQLRIIDRSFYASLYHSSAYNWTDYGGKELSNANVEFVVRDPEGRIIFERKRPLSQLPMTSPRANVIDFLLLSYRPEQNPELRRLLEEDLPIEIEFSFYPEWAKRQLEPIEAHLIIEAGQFKN